MARHLRSVWIAAFTALALPVYAADNEAQLWLERMTHALAERNYIGQFFHLSGSHSENLQIIHRVADGKVTERLVSLDGNGREIIRTDTEVTCYLPDQRTVVVEKRKENDSLLATVPSYTTGL